MSGFGGVVTFEVKGDLKTTSAFIDRLRIPTSRRRLAASRA